MHVSCISLYIIYFMKALALLGHPGSHSNQLCDFSKQQNSLELNFLTQKMGFNIYMPTSQDKLENKSEKCKISDK